MNLTQKVLAILRECPTLSVQEVADRLTLDGVSFHRPSMRACVNHCRRLVGIPPKPKGVSLGQKVEAILRECPNLSSRQVGDRLREQGTKFTTNSLACAVSQARKALDIHRPTLNDLVGQLVLDRPQIDAFEALEAIGGEWTLHQVSLALLRMRKRLGIKKERRLPLPLPPRKEIDAKGESGSKKSLKGERRQSPWKTVVEQLDAKGQAGQLAWEDLQILPIRHRKALAVKFGIVRPTGEKHQSPWKTVIDQLDAKGQAGQLTWEDLQILPIRHRKGLAVKFGLTKPGKQKIQPLKRETLTSKITNILSESPNFSSSEVLQKLEEQSHYNGPLTTIQNTCTYVRRKLGIPSQKTSRPVPTKKAPLVQKETLKGKIETLVRECPTLTNGEILGRIRDQGHTPSPKTISALSWQVRASLGAPSPHKQTGPTLVEAITRILSENGNLNNQEIRQQLAQRGILAPRSSLAATACQVREKLGISAPTQEEGEKCQAILNKLLEISGKADHSLTFSQALKTLPTSELKNVNKYSQSFKDMREEYIKQNGPMYRNFINKDYCPIINLEVPKCVLPIKQNDKAPYTGEEKELLAKNIKAVFKAFKKNRRLFDYAFPDFSSEEKEAEAMTMALKAIRGYLSRNKDFSISTYIFKGMVFGCRNIIRCRTTAKIKSLFTYNKDGDIVWEPSTEDKEVKDSPSEVLALAVRGFEQVASLPSEFRIIEAIKDGALTPKAIELQTGLSCMTIRTAFEHLREKVKLTREGCEVLECLAG